MAIPAPTNKTINDPREHLAHLSALTRAANRFENMTVGPGLEVHRTAGGVGIGLVEKAAEEPAKAATPEDCSGGTELDLGSEQGTQDEDTWNRDTDTSPVSVTTITDVQYNTTSHQLTYRTRTLHFDKCGKLTSVDAEGDLIVITTAEVCA